MNFLKKMKLLERVFRCAAVNGSIFERATDVTGLFPSMQGHYVLS